jgi:hypothetical protein
VLKHEQVTIRDRMWKVFEDANIQLNTVIAEVMGASGHAMLRAIIGGQWNAVELAALARGRPRGKIPLLQ